MDEFQRDAEMLASLQPVAAALGQLQELVDDTLLEVSGEAYASALAVSSFARAGGQGAAPVAFTSGGAGRGRRWLNLFYRENVRELNGQRIL